jgi:hypothetical protein
MYYYDFLDRLTSMTINTELAAEYVCDPTDMSKLVGQHRALWGPYSTGMQTAAALNWMRGDPLR